jgi:hypothetical protein
MMGKLFAAYLVGIAIALVSMFAGLYQAESECQVKHNVADCEMLDNPFVPAMVGETK